MNSKTVSQYEQDFYGWTQWQVRVLANRQVSELDWQNLQEELQALGRQEYRELVSRLSVLLGHLLKWQYQPENRFSQLVSDHQRTTPCHYSPFLS